MKYECKDTHSESEESVSQSEWLDSSAEYLEDVENENNVFDEHNGSMDLIAVESPDNSEEILGKWQNLSMWNTN